MCKKSFTTSLVDKEIYLQAASMYSRHLGAFFILRFLNKYDAIQTARLPSEFTGNTIHKWVSMSAKSRKQE